MAARFPRALAALKALAPTVLVFAVLGLVGWWGATHQWKIEPLAKLFGSADEKKDEPEAEKEPGEEGKDRPLVPIDLKTEEAVDKAGLKSADARRQPVGEYVSANGEVDFDQDRIAHLASRAPGTVWSVEKKVGDPVSQGEVMALVSAADVGKAKADFAAALVQYQVRQKTLERARAASANIPEKQVREAEAMVREAHIRLVADQQVLLNLGFEVRLRDFLSLSDDEIALKLRVLGLPESVLRRVDVQTLTSNLLPITAPFEGVVTQRDLVVGEPVSTLPMQVMHFTVADLRQVWIMLHARLEDAPRLHKGQEVLFRPDGATSEAPSGEVAWVSPDVDEKTRTVTVRIEVPNPGGRLRPRAFGTGRILVAQRDGIVVPETALQWDGTSHVVFVRLSETKFQPRRVEIGVRGDDWVEVRKGIDTGEPLVTAGSHVLKSEMLKDRLGED